MFRYNIDCDAFCQQFDSNNLNLKTLNTKQKESSASNRWTGDFTLAF